MDTTPPPVVVLPTLPPAADPPVITLPDIVPVLPGDAPALAPELPELVPVEVTIPEVPRVIGIAAPTEPPRAPSTTVPTGPAAAPVVRSNVADGVLVPATLGPPPAVELGGADPLARVAEATADATAAAFAAGSTQLRPDFATLDPRVGRDAAASAAIAGRHGPPGGLGPHRRGGSLGLQHHGRRPARLGPRGLQPAGGAGRLHPAGLGPGPGGHHDDAGPARA